MIIIDYLSISQMGDNPLLSGLTGTEPLSCRASFDIPDSVAYLDTAARGPSPLLVLEAGLRVVRDGACPWSNDAHSLGSTVERLRQLAGQLIGAAPADMAVVGSVSHAMAVAARNMALPDGASVLRLAGDHPSSVLEWERLARRSGAKEIVVSRPSDGDWTNAILETLSRGGADRPAVAVLPPLHWCDGALIDLDAIVPKLRECETALVVDATHAAGMLDLDVAVLKPAFVAFPSFKWLLGPYGLAFLYVAPDRQLGEPSDFNFYNSDVTENFGFAAFKDGARRFDRGERNDPVDVSMAIAGLDLLAGWPRAESRLHAKRMMSRLIEAIEGHGFGLSAMHHAPHIAGLRHTVPSSVMREELRKHNVFASDRAGCLRVSIHRHVIEDDVMRAASAMLEIAEKFA